jgi:hypothetical protein
MDIDLVKRFLKHYAAGKTLDSVTIRELYLSGYIEIDLNAVGKELLPTAITEKGKRVLEQQTHLGGL